MTQWEWFTWSNVFILGMGAPVVLGFFLRDLRHLLAQLTSPPSAAEAEDETVAEEGVEMVEPQCEVGG